MSKPPHLATVEPLRENTHLDIPRQLRTLATEIESGRAACRGIIATMVMKGDVLQVFAFSQLSRYEIAGIAVMGAHKIANTIDAEPMPE